MRIIRISGSFLISLVFLSIVVFLINTRISKENIQTHNDLIGISFSKHIVPKPKVRKANVGRLDNSSDMVVPVAPHPKKVINTNHAVSNNPSPIAFTGPVQQQDIPADLTYTTPSTLATSPSIVRVQPKRQNLKVKVQNDSVVTAALKPTSESIALGNVEVPKHIQGISFNRKISANSPPNGADFDDVFYKSHGTNPFIDTEDDNFSTFAMDVDTASYAVMRRYLRDGYLPPTDAVRVEEFVNTFDYNYKPPTGCVKFLA